MSLFGTSIALSADGNTAIIGGASDNGGRGAAWIFVRSGGIWTQQQKLTGEGEQGPGQFGFSVALSPDGNTALVGGPEDDSGTGAVWFFTRSGSTWTQRQEDEGRVPKSLPNKNKWGYSVALSKEGNIALVGAPGANRSPANTEGVIGGGQGAVYQRSESTWTLIKGLYETGEKTSEAGEGGLGYSVSLSADGKEAILGAPYDNGGKGAIWLAHDAGVGLFLSVAKHKPPAEAEQGFEDGMFGSSVAISADGQTALIGEPDYDIEASQPTGAAWVLVPPSSGEVWVTEGGRFRASAGPFLGGFGTSVALSGDGSTALIGSPLEAEEPELTPGLGSGWVYSRSGSSWSQRERLAGTGQTNSGIGREEGPRFGASVALSTDASTALIGGPEDNNEVGAAWPFALGEASKEEEGGAAPPPPPPPPGGATAAGGSTGIPATGGSTGKAVIPPIAPTKPLTQAQKLVKALKVCAKDKPRGKRKACETKAKKRYAPKPKKTTKPKKKG